MSKNQWGLQMELFPISFKNCLGTKFAQNTKGQKQIIILYRMLENDSSESVLTWGLNGTTFIVRDTMEFSRTVLPKHFKHSNFASFVRQLNKYDFHKVRQLEDSQRPYGDQVLY